MTSEIELLNKAREDFLAKRAKQEMQIAAWAEKIEKVDPEILKDIDLPPVITLKALIPEMYADKPNPETYKQQYESCTALFNKVNEIADHYNEEAKRCLLEYQEISSKQPS